MELFTFKSLHKLAYVTLATFSLSFVGMAAHAQMRNYSIVYSDNIRGNSTVFGNTLLHIIDGGKVNTAKMNDNSADGNSIYENNDENLQYIDIDGKTGNGSVTRNSSSADLLLPGGTNTIKLARLYWGGFVVKSDFNLATPENRKIKIRKGTTNVYDDVRALGMDTVTVNNIYAQYQAYADITEFVKNNGAGTYSVGNAPLSVGKYNISGANGGWCIVVVYENTAVGFNSIRLYDGFQQVYSGGSSLTNTVTLTGLNVPSGALASEDAKMGVVTWEGDANLKTDFLKINGNVFSNPTNPADNPWNGTITNNGVHVTTKNPSYTNQMGIDIDQFDAGTGYGILPNDNTVTLEFGTEKDRYFPGLFTFSIKMKDPEITVDKSAKDANNNSLGEINEVLTYTLKGKNTGIGNANSVVITDTLPYSVTYVPNSLKIISSPGVTAGIQTDAAGDDNAEYIVDGSYKTIRFRLGTGSTATSGGTLGADETYEVEYKVTVNDPGTGSYVTSIVNIARITALSDAGVKFVDDGTAIVNPLRSPLPVTLVSFTGTLLQESKVQLDWASSMEINCSQYKVERSVDGKVFYEVSAVAGNGTTSSLHSYTVTDNIFSAASPVVYYRLKQIDLDKKASYSKVIAVKLKSLSREINISPNPFSSYLNINMDWSRSEIITVKVINTQGKEVINRNIQMNKGLNYVSIEELSRLSPGNYFIQFISLSERTTKKITKQ